MPKPRREGYLLIDHTQSPGISPEQAAAVAAATGRDAPTVGAGKLFESATVTCLHCGVIVVLNPKRTRPRGYCARCDGYTCDKPACGMECRSLDKLLDYVQAQCGKAEDRGTPLVGLPDLTPLFTTVSVPVSAPPEEKSP